MNRKNIAWPFFLAALMTVLTNASPRAEELYRNSKRPIDERITDLLGRLTLEEKAAQLLQIELIPWGANPADYADPAVLQKTLEKAFHGQSVGLVLSPIGWPVRETLRFNKAVHEYALNHTRLGVPVMIFHCNMHGVMSLDTTVFPQYIAQGATWNPDLIGEMAEPTAPLSNRRNSWRRRRPPSPGDRPSPAAGAKGSMPA